MSLASNVESLATRTATECKSLRTLINNNQPNLSALTTTAKTNLVAAINEVNALSGGASALTDLTDVTLTTPATGHLLRHNGTEFVNVLGSTWYEAAGAAALAQAASQPVDSDLTSIAALTTTAYGRAFLTLANQAALTALIPAASQTVPGLIEVATAAENTTGTDDTRAVSSLGLQTRMAAYVLATSQPLDSDLTSIAALTTTAFGRSLLTPVDAAAARTLLACAATAHTHVLADLPDAWVKQSVRAASTGNLTLSAPQTVDGVALIANDRVLVKNQSAGSQNGIYIVAAGAWTRALDMDTVSEAAGAAVNVDQGLTQKGQTWTTTLATTDVLGTTTMSWYRLVDTSMVGVANGVAGLDASALVPVAQLPLDSRYQPTDADLTAIAAVASQTAYGRAVLALVDAAGARTYFGAEAAGAAAAAQAASQPLDGDLTSIAALTTTAYGRALLTQASQTTLMALLAAASATVAGIVELATDAEAVTGTDTVRATTPANVAAVFLDRIDTNVNLGASNVKVPSQAAVKAYADNLIGANDAMIYKGVIDASTNPNYPAGNKGDTYRISVAGKVGGAAGPNVEVGDMIVGLTDGSASGTHATVGANWNIIQANMDGQVVGPVSAVSGDFAMFSGTSGKVIADTGLALDTDAALAANSNLKIPSQAAVKAYAQPLDADLTAIAALASQTAFGRSFLQLVDAAAARTLISTYSQVEIGSPTTDFVATFNAGLV